MILFYVTLIFIILVSGISFYNLLTAPGLRRQEYNGHGLVSVLIPARNEEDNIEKCIQSVLVQGKIIKEIIVLNDESTDNTRKIVTNLQNDYPLVRMMNGEALPNNWLGKNYACHQLAMEASGEFLLFIDADVKLEPGAVDTALATLNNSGSDLLSVFPDQKVDSAGEQLVVPLMGWLLLTFLPLKMVRTSRRAQFAAANGQFMMWKKASYFVAGGHEGVKNKVVEDVELARKVKQSGMKLITVLGKGLVSCRMYDGFSAAVKGFSKNFFPGFGFSPFSFMLMLILIEAVFLLPFFLVFFNSVYLFNVLLILTSRIYLALALKKNILINLLLHPVQMIILFVIGILSLQKTLGGKLEWKERKL